MDDLFEDVCRDAKQQLEELRRGGGSAELAREAAETIADLERSVQVARQSGAEDIQERERRVRTLKQELDSLTIDNDVAEDVSIGSPSEGPVNVFQDQMLEEQDVHLDDIHRTMQTLHLQAQTMGHELTDQEALLEDMDAGIDTVSGKIAQGRRRLEWVYQKNKEKFDDCCIGLLIAALLVLLVLAFIL